MACDNNHTTIDGRIDIVYLQRQFQFYPPNNRFRICPNIAYFMDTCYCPACRRDKRASKKT